MTLDEYLAQPGALTVAELRKRIGAKSDAQVRQWRHGYAKRRPSAEYAVAIEKATAGQVTCEELLPDVDWSYLRSSCATPPAPAQPEADRRHEDRRQGNDRRGDRRQGDRRHGEGEE